MTKHPVRRKLKGAIGSLVYKTFGGCLKELERQREKRCTARLNGNTRLRIAAPLMGPLDGAHDIGASNIPPPNPYSNMFYGNNIDPDPQQPEDSVSRYKNDIAAEFAHLDVFQVRNAFLRNLEVLGEYERCLNEPFDPNEVALMLYFHEYNHDERTGEVTIQWPGTISMRHTPEDRRIDRLIQITNNLLREAKNADIITCISVEGAIRWELISYSDELPELPEPLKDLPHFLLKLGKIERGIRAPAQLSSQSVGPSARFSFDYGNSNELDESYTSEGYDGVGDTGDPCLNSEQLFPSNGLDESRAWEEDGAMDEGICPSLNNARSGSANEFDESDISEDESMDSTIRLSFNDAALGTGNRREEFYMQDRERTDANVYPRTADENVRSLPSTTDIPLKSLRLLLIFHEKHHRTNGYFKITSRRRKYHWAKKLRMRENILRPLQGLSEKDALYRVLDEVDSIVQDTVRHADQIKCSITKSGQLRWELISWTSKSPNVPAIFQGLPHFTVGKCSGPPRWTPDASFTKDWRSELTDRFHSYAHENNPASSSK